MSVEATGTGTISTPARPVAATTSGSTAPGGGNFTQVQATFSVADPFYQLAKVYINGVELLPSNNQWLTTNGVPAPSIHSRCQSSKNSSDQRR